MRKMYILCGIVLLIVCGGCKKDYALELQSAVKHYSKNDKESTQKIAYVLLKKNAYAEIRAKNLVLHENHLFSKTSTMDFHYPVKTTIATGSIKPRIFYVDENYTIHSDNKLISLVDKKTGETKIIKAANSRHLVKSLVVHVDKIYYYKNQHLYYYDIPTGNSGLFVRDTFAPPYTGYYKKFNNDYRASLMKRNNALGILVGNGGSYLFSIINLDDKSIKIKDLAMSSTKIAFNNESITYMAGNAGGWQYMSLDLSSKKKKVRCVFKDLLDIIIVKDGYALITKDGMFISGVDCKKIEIPAIYRLHGAIDDSIVLSYQQKVFVCSFGSLLRDFMVLQEKIPVFLNK